MSTGCRLQWRILDIDFFKQYNDNYGHQQGDECIIAIADELKKMEDRQTFCARYGGDEFIIITQVQVRRKCTRRQLHSGRILWI